MPDKNQLFMFSADELSLIKNTFSDNDTLLYTIRKGFLQFPLTDVERGLLTTSLTPGVLRVLRKRILPELSPEYPLGQLPSLLTTLTNDLKSKPLDDMALQFEAKQIELDYLEQQFKALTEATEETILLKALGEMKGKSDTQRFVDLTAYLFLLGYIDPMLNFMKVLAGAKDETPEEQNKRLLRDSSK